VFLVVRESAIKNDKHIFRRTGHGIMNFWDRDRACESIIAFNIHGIEAAEGRLTTLHALLLRLESEK
jgi:hypothetical protein